MIIHHRPSRLELRILAAGTPIAVGLLLLRFPLKAHTVLGALVGLAFVVLASRRPGAALAALIPLVTFELFGFALLYHFGVPGSLLRQAGALKECLGLGVLASAFLGARRSRVRLDRLDKLALVYLAGVSCYLAFPQIVSTPGFPHDMTTRLLGFRNNTGFVLVFLAARHAPISARARSWMRVSLIATALIVGAVAMYQYASPSGWSHFVTHTAELPRFERNVTHESEASIQQALNYLKEKPYRVNAVFSGPFDLADFMLLALAFAAESIVSRPGIRAIGATALVAAGMLVSQTRADLFGAAAVAALLLVPGRGRPAALRVRWGLILAAASVVVVPFLFGGGRYVGNANAHHSSVEHTHELNRGLTELAHDPRGLGLGTSPDLLVRQNRPGRVISDNSFLQVGDELGVVLMVLFAVLLLTLLTTLRRAARDRPHDPLPRSLLAAGIALTGVGMVHHVWLNYSVSWAFWGLAGLALSRRAPGSPAAPGGDTGAVAGPRREPRALALSGHP